MVELVDTPDLGSGAERRMGSSPFSRKMVVVAKLSLNCGNSSVVELHLAKVEVAGSNPVSRF